MNPTTATAAGAIGVLVAHLGGEVYWQPIGDPCTIEGRRKVLCRCICGKERFVQLAHLRAGKSRSCGCVTHDARAAQMGRDSRRHGMRKSPEWLAWRNMRVRCAKPLKRSKTYGERGITVCTRWQVFENFLADMGLRPSPDHSLERIDNSKGYEPGNCRWATMVDQQNNRGSNKRLTIGIRVMTVAQWARHSGIPASVIYKRLDAGWAVDRAVFEPVISRRPSS